MKLLENMETVLMSGGLGVSCAGVRLNTHDFRNLLDLGQAAEALADAMEVNDKLRQATASVDLLRLVREIREEEGS